MILRKHFCNALHYRMSILIFTILFLRLPVIFAQDKMPVNFGDIGREDFAINQSQAGSNSNALIIADIGTTKFEGNTKGWFSYIFKRQTRIKLINQNGFDAATSAILLYHNSDGAEKAEDISATTYTLENGKVSAIKLNSKDIFTVKADKNHSLKKFTLPGIKEGCIIEYSYTIKSNFIFNLPSWEFQNHRYPVLWSEYNIALPALLSYMTFIQGYHKFAINKNSEGFQNFIMSRNRPIPGSLLSNREELITVSSPILKQRWVMKDIPSFNMEAYISTPDNFIDKISFQLYKTYNGESFHDVTTNWKTVTEELMQREDFGKPLTEDNRLLNETLQQVVNKNDNELQAAKKIYYYIQNNYSCTNRNDKYITTSLQDVIRKKSGTVGDINLLMLAMLKLKLSYALPVLLGTTEHGINSNNYPQMDRMNYVICKIKIDTTEYFLDATVSYLPFGKLASNCYNGQARILNEDTAAVYFYPKMHKERSSTAIFINADLKDEMSGRYTKIEGLYKSIETKTIVSNSLISFEKMLASRFPEEIKITKMRIDSSGKAEDTMQINIDFTINNFADADIVYFNPMLTEALKTNPFYAAERIYPVEMPYVTDESYVLNMQIPKGYKVDEMPKSTRIKLNNEEGLFEYLISSDGNYINLRCRTLLNEVNFSSEDYSALRDYFSLVVKKQAEQIVFKKIK